MSDFSLPSDPFERSLKIRDYKTEVEDTRCSIRAIESRRLRGDSVLSKEMVNLVCAVREANRMIFELRVEGVFSQEEYDERLAEFRPYLPIRPYTRSALAEA